MAGAVVKVRPPPVWVAVKVRIWLLSLGGPALIAVAKFATAWAPASSFTVGGLPGRLKEGASFIGLTVMVKVVLALGAGEPGPSSVRITSNVAVPLASGAAW